MSFLRKKSLEGILHSFTKVEKELLGFQQRSVEEALGKEEEIKKLQEEVTTHRSEALRAGLVAENVRKIVNP